MESFYFSLSFFFFFFFYSSTECYSVREMLTVLMNRGGSALKVSWRSIGVELTEEIAGMRKQLRSLRALGRW